MGLLGSILFELADEAGLVDKAVEKAPWLLDVGETMMKNAQRAANNANREISKREKSNVEVSDDVKDRVSALKESSNFTLEAIQERKKELEENKKAELEAEDEDEEFDDEDIDDDEDDYHYDKYIYKLYDVEFENLHDWIDKERNTIKEIELKLKEEYYE